MRTKRRESPKGQVGTRKREKRKEVSGNPIKKEKKGKIYKWEPYKKEKV